MSKQEDDKVIEELKRQGFDQNGAEEALKGIRKGISDAKACRVSPWSEIEKEMK